MEKFFNTPSTVKALGMVPALQGAQASALKSVTTNFVGITNILGEGSIAEGYVEFANQKILEAKLAVENAIAHGWNVAKSTY